MISEDFFEKSVCRTCTSQSLERVIKLTPTPPGNNFLKKEELNQNQDTFPLELNFCNSCNHIQLGHVVDPKVLYQNNYSYVSGTSKVFVNHLKEYANYMIEMLNMTSSSFVLDIGSNDGTCLSFFKERHIKVLGVDPAQEICQISISRGIDTINDFFSKELAQEIESKKGKCDLITSHNTCAHIDNLDSVIEGVEFLLKEDGIFVMEVGYFVDVFQNKWFDTIYHEHLDYHTVKPLKSLFNRFNMEIFKVERIEPQGGSIRVMVKKIKSKRRVDDSTNILVDLEKSLGLDQANTLKKFEEDINKLKKEFKSIIERIKKNDKTIAAYGAPTKATTLCYHFEIGPEEIDFIVDDNPLKQDLFSPGKLIPVYNNKKIFEEKPNYLLILAWNFSDSIMKNNKEFFEKIGSFIIPMPKPEVIHGFDSSNI